MLSRGNPTKRATGNPSDRKRKALLAATEVFAEKGYDCTSMDDVAAKAGVSKPTVYQYFSDKQGLFGEIVRATVGEIEDIVRLVAESMVGVTNLESNLTALARRLISALMEPRILRLRRLIMANFERFPEVTCSWYEQGFERLLAELAISFQALADRKLLHVSNPTLAANHFAGMLLWVPINKAMFTGENSSSPEELELYAVAAVRAFLTGYGPPTDRSPICTTLPMVTETMNMKLNESSRTALMVARQRAAHQVLDHGSVLNDPFAMRILREDEESVLQFAKAHPLASIGRLVTAARSRIAEDALSRAVESGTLQIVILGAGLDTFALRNPYRAQHINIYEVDHPATQASKRQRLADAQIALPQSLIFVPVDFERDNLEKKLTEAGFQQNATVFFVWLGVVPYLTQDALDVTLDYISSIRNSEVVFDYLEPPEGSSKEVGQLEKHRADQLERMGEPSVSRFEPADIAAILHSHGICVIQDIGFQEIASRFGDFIQGLASGQLGVHVVHAKKC